jgi:hypothetical protein
MRGLRDQVPSAKHFIIAHSHGGNVALYAAERTQVDGIVCLATPFIHAAARDESLIGMKAIQRGLFGMACLVIIATVAPLGWVMLLVVLTACSVLCSLLAAVAAGLMGVATRTAKRLAEFATAKCPVNTDLCVFRVTGDEASLSLAGGQLLAWGTTKLYSYMVSKKELNFLTQPLRHVPIPEAFWLLPVLSMIAAAAGFLLGSENSAAASALLVLGKIGIAISMLGLAWAKTTIFDNLLYGLSFILLLAASLVGMPLIGTRPPAELIGGIRAGWILGLGYFLAVDFYTEPTPPGGPWRLYQFPRHADPASNDELGLAHSIYNDPNVRARVASWLAESARR